MRLISLGARSPSNVAAPEDGRTPIKLPSAVTDALLAWMLGRLTRVSVFVWTTKRHTDRLVCIFLRIVAFMFLFDQVQLRDLEDCFASDGRGWPKRLCRYRLNCSIFC